MQQHAIETFDNLVNRTTEIVRPGRSFPRKKSPNGHTIIITSLYSLTKRH